MDDKKLDQVRKLLELSKHNTNVNEASAAAAQAQRLMSKYAISEAMLDVSPDDDEASEQIEVDTLHKHGSRSLPTWKGSLGVVMAEVNQCKCYRLGNELRIIGRPSDAATVRYLFSYVAREIDRLTAEESSLRGNPGRTWCNNFRLGAVSEINKRLEAAESDARAAMKQEADASDDMGTGAALVRVNNAIAKLDKRSEAVEDYGKRKLHLRSGGSRRSRYDAGARAAGKRAGARINLDRGGAALGSGNSRKLTG